MPNPTDPTTVREHLRELQNLVQDSLRQWNLATDTASAAALAGQSNPNRLSHELHPLGPVQVGTLQRDFKEKIAAIRAICLSFAQGPLHQSLNGGDSSNLQQFKKYAALLKDETQLEEALSSVKLSMTQCQNTLRAASQDGNIKKDHLINTIRDMSTKLGLECYLETGSRPNNLLPVSTLTIGGNVIVVDIDVESTGAILRVKVSYASEIHQDERIDRLLAHNLRCKCGKLLQTQETDKPSDVNLTHLADCSRDFDAFSKNLKALATLDSFTKKYPNIDFFHNMRAMDLDFKELFKREMSLTGGDLQRVFREGHGLPMTHAVLPGPSVAYWASRADLLDVSWDVLSTAIEQGANEKVKVPFHRISIIMEESTQSACGYLPTERSGFLLSQEETSNLSSVPYGSIMNDQGSVSGTTVLQQPLRWIVPNTDSSVEATYVAVLHPPVVVAEEVAKQLAALSNQAGLSSTMGYHRDPGYLSLQELLINQNIEQTQWEIALDQGPGAVRQRFSFDRTKNEARLLHRIPFTHISQVYLCTKILRQQLSFNTLFQSCFKETVTADATRHRTGAVTLARPGLNEDAALEVSIVVQTPQPPNMILVSFMNPYTESHMVLEILIDAGTGLPTARLVITGQTPGSIGSGVDMNQGGRQDAAFAVENEKLTMVLQTCDNIPILVRWLLRRSFAWVKERHQHQQLGKGQVHLGRRSSSYAEEGGILKRPRQ
ncbi:hypothetical protein BGZ70_005522 [Mortierella alpina]|uniref:Mediator of RNA polymerase II transcription subunit 1 n=1 Tax=Mortierella alpina TaxID=64518 RepID=A0A9P6J9E7_MORAP|nr:hypothetical protein BGZ70_005522 [Mortierella alpina]